MLRCDLILPNVDCQMAFMLKDVLSIPAAAVDTLADV
jgi:hypothetical protein